MTEKQVPEKRAGTTQTARLRVWLLAEIRREIETRTPKYGVALRKAFAEAKSADDLLARFDDAVSQFRGAQEFEPYSSLLRDVLDLEQKIDMLRLAGEEVARAPDGRSFWYHTSALHIYAYGALEAIEVVASRMGRGGLVSRALGSEQKERARRMREDIHLSRVQAVHPARYAKGQAAVDGIVNEGHHELAAFDDPRYTDPSLWYPPPAALQDTWNAEAHAALAVIRTVTNDIIKTLLAAAGAGDYQPAR